MPTELQELQLRVQLMDEASAGVAKLRDELKGLAQGEGKKNLDKLKAEQAELGKQVKELAELAEGGGKALMGYVGKFGAAGAAFGGFAAVLGVGLHTLKEYADKITELSNKAKVIGMNPAELKSIIEQYERLGVSADVTEQSMAGLSQTLAEVNRLGSQRREQMIQAAGSWGLLMMQGIERVQAQTSMAEKLNEILLQSQNVYDNRLIETKGNAADANKSENDFLKLWGLDPSIKVLRNIAKVSDAEKRRMEEKEKLTANYRNALFDLKKEWLDWADEIKDSMLSSDGIVVTGLRLALQLTRQLHEIWKQPWFGTASHAAIGAGARLIPGVGTALTTMDLIKAGTGMVRGSGEAAPPKAEAAPKGDGGLTQPDFNDRFGQWGAPKPQAPSPAQPLMSAPATGDGGGKSTFDTPGFASDWSWMRRSQDIEDRRDVDNSLRQGDDYLSLIKQNTAEMKKLNENFVQLDLGQVQLKGLGGLPGFAQGGDGGGGALPGGGGSGVGAPPGGGPLGLGDFGGKIDGGGGGSAPYGSSVGVGSGTGAGASSPATGRGGGTTTAYAPPSGGVEPPPLATSGGAGGVARTYERRRGERGEFNYAETGAFGKPGANLTTIKLKNGRTVQVNKAGAEQFRGFFNDLIDRGYKINSIGGFNYREKRGGGGLSEHSWGTAVDVNPDRNAFKGKTTDLPKDVEEMAWRRGVSWGGRFGDPMHFEIMSPEAAAHKKKILEERGVLDTASQDKSIRTVKVETNGKLTADVNAPRGAKVSVEGGGAFSKTETNRTMPMDNG